MQSINTRALSLASTLAIGLVSTTPSHAQSTEASAQGVLHEIVVTSRRYVDLTSSGATKLPLAVDEIPQSIGLIGDGFITMAKLEKIEDVADYAAGVQNQGSIYGNFGVIKSRGFKLDSTFGYRINGYRAFIEQPIDPRFLRNVEIVRGPSSVVYGIGSPGGLINLNPKTARDTLEGHVELETDFDKSSVYGQYGGPVDQDGRVKMLGALSYAAGEQHLNFLDEDRQLASYLNTLIDLGGGFDLSLLGYFSDIEMGSSDGVPFYRDGTVPALERDFLLGDPRINRHGLDGQNYVAIAGLQYANDSGLTGGLNVGFNETSGTYDLSYPFGLEDDGDVGLYGFHRPLSTRVTNIEGRMQYDFDLFGQTGSSILVSAGYDKVERSDVYYEYTYNNSPGVIVNLNQGQSGVIEALNAAGAPVLAPTPLFGLGVDTEQWTASMQSVLRPLPRTSIVTGLSLTKTEQHFQRDQSDLEYDSEASLRLGLVYELFDDVNVYAAYNDSFIPQSQLDVNNNVLPPLTGTQYELGVKANLLQEQLLLTASFFEIMQENTASIIPNTLPERYEPIGAVKHRGVELEGVGQLTPNWSILANFTYLDAKIDESSNPAEIGRRRPFNPETSGSMYTTYKISEGRLAGLGFGGGVRYVGSSRTSVAADTRDLDGHTLIDAVIYYDHETWSVNLNARNLFNEDYWRSTYDRIVFGLQRGEPASITLTLTYRL